MGRWPHGTRSLAGRAGWPLLGGVVLVAVVRALADLVPLLLRDDRFAGDAAQHTWWMYRLVRPSLFPDSLAARYYALPAFSPPGYQTLVRWLAHAMDVQHAVELLAIGLALLTVALTAVLGFRLGNKTGAATALAVLIATHGERLVEGGFPRSFGLPLLLVGVWSVYRRRWLTLGVVFVLTALLYPPVVLNLAPLAAVVLAIGLRRHGRPPRDFALFAALALAAAAILVSLYARPFPPDVGRWFGYDEIRRMPEWHRDGRVRFFIGGLAFYFSGPLTGIGLTTVQAAGVGLLLALTVLACPEAICFEAWVLLGGAMVMWALAHALLLRLYLPSRYLTYAGPVFVMMWAAGAAREAKAWLLYHWPGVKRVRPAAVGLAAAAAVAVLAYDGAQALAARREPGNWVTADGYDAALAFVATFPPATLVAAHPDDANAVPIRCHRNVLVNTETSVAFNTAYYAEMRRRIDASFDLLYATEWARVDAIAAHEGVSVFVLDRRRLRDPDARPYYQPFRDANATRIAAGRASGFALLSPPAGRVLFAAGDVIVLRVGPGATMTRPKRIFAAACLALTVAIVLGVRWFGPHDLYEKDQPKTMAYTADMVLNDRYSLPRDVIYQPATKPPMYNWIDAVVVGVSGSWREWTLKVPSILGVLATGAIVLAMARRATQCGVGLLPTHPPAERGQDAHATEQGIALQRSALLVGLLAAGVWFTFGSDVRHGSVLRMSYLARPDMLLCGWCTAAWACFTVAVEKTSARAALRFAVGGWLCVTAAALTKGPAALLPPIFAVLYALLLPSAGSSRASAVNRLWLPVGVPIVVVGVGAWLACAARQDWDHVKHVILGAELAGRVMDQSPEGFRKPVYYSAMWFVTKAQPWGAVAVLALLAWATVGKFRRDWAPAALYLIVVLIGLSLPAGKRMDYLLPAYAPAAVLIAGLVFWCAQRFATTVWWTPLVPLLLAAMLGRTYLMKFHEAQEHWSDRAVAFVKQVNAVRGGYRPRVLVLVRGKHPLTTLLGLHPGSALTQFDLERAEYVIMPQQPDLKAVVLSDPLPMGFETLETRPLSVLGLYYFPPGTAPADRLIALQKEVGTWTTDENPYHAAGTVYRDE